MFIATPTPRSTRHPLRRQRTLLARAILIYLAALPLANRLLHPSSYLSSRRDSDSGRRFFAFQLGDRARRYHPRLFTRACTLINVIYQPCNFSLSSLFRFLTRLFLHRISLVTRRFRYVRACNKVRAVLVTREFTEQIRTLD